jgi:hypothetical protein
MLWIFKLSILDSFTTQFPKELWKRVGNWVSVISSSSSLSFLFFSFLFLHGKGTIGPKAVVLQIGIPKRKKK